MDRFNSNEEPEQTPISIAKEIVYSPDYDDRNKAVQLITEALDEARNAGYSECILEHGLTPQPDGSEPLPGELSSLRKENEILKLLNEAREKYSELLTQELNGVIPYAVHHGWGGSDKYEIGLECRENIASLETKLKELE